MSRIVWTVAEFLSGCRALGDAQVSTGVSQLWPARLDASGAWVGDGWQYATSALASPGCSTPRTMVDIIDRTVPADKRTLPIVTSGGLPLARIESGVAKVNHGNADVADILRLMTPHLQNATNGLDRMVVPRDDALMARKLRDLFSLSAHSTAAAMAGAIFRLQDAPFRQDVIRLARLLDGPYKDAAFAVLHTCLNEYGLFRCILPWHNFRTFLALANDHGMDARRVQIAACESGLDVWDGMDIIQVSVDGKDRWWPYDDFLSALGNQAAGHEHLRLPIGDPAISVRMYRSSLTAEEMSQL